MGLTKSGEIQYRSRFSQCQKCSHFLKDYNCWYNNYIPYRTWENIIGYECDKFKSLISNQCNSHYVHLDYEDRDRFPEIKYGGKYRFNSKGERI